MGKRTRPFRSLAASEPLSGSKTNETPFDLQRPGIAVRGKLAESVIRPVVKGSVIAIQAYSLAGKTWDEDMPSLVFTSFADRGIGFQPVGTAVDRLEALEAYPTSINSSFSIKVN